MKKVLFFIESLAGGGAEKVLSDLVSNLEPAKYDVTVISVADGGVYESIVKKHSHYHSVFSNDDYKSGGWKKLWYILKYKLIYSLPAPIAYLWMIQGAYDVEIAFVEGFATRLIAASPNQNSKKLTWVHTDMKKNPYACNGYKSQAEHRLVYEKYDKVCCVSQSVKEVFNTMFFNDKRVVVQYNPVDSAEVMRKGRERVDLIPNQTLQMGTIGRLEEQKGFIRLLDCLGRLKGKGYQFGLWIAGEGSQRPQLEALMKKYQLQEQVKLLGFQENPYRYMDKCDVFVCSSYAEGFSTAATESLILGKPIFTTECAGMQELFGAEKCGEIVPNTDEALYEMLENLLSGKWKAADYTEAVARRSLDFDIKKRMQEIETILDT
ncbi:MAG: glycosyltransferase [Lachnospiraceae bacterium]